MQVFDVKAGKLVGDVLIAASFVSYCGPFNMQFREDLVVDKWLKDLTDKKVRRDATHANCHAAAVTAGRANMFVRKRLQLGHAV